MSITVNRNQLIAVQFAILHLCELFPEQGSIMNEHQVTNAIKILIRAFSELKPTADILPKNRCQLSTHKLTALHTSIKELADYYSTAWVVSANTVVTLVRQIMTDWNQLGNHS